MKIDDNKTNKKGPRWKWTPLICVAQYACLCDFPALQCGVRENKIKITLLQGPQFAAASAYSP